MKADLQDLLFSDKWTPDAYLIARVCVPDDFERDDKDDFTDNERYTSYNMCVCHLFNSRSRLPQLIQHNHKVQVNTLNTFD